MVSIVGWDGRDTARYRMLTRRDHNCQPMGGVKHNRYFNRGGSRKVGGRRGKGVEGAENSEAAREARDDRDEFEIHEGSFKLHEVQALPEWEKRVIQPSSSVKRKYAVCFGYLGSRYQGLQINADAHTIEKELETAQCSKVH